MLWTKVFEVPCKDFLSVSSLPSHHHESARPAALKKAPRSPCHPPLCGWGGEACSLNAGYRWIYNEVIDITIVTGITLSYSDTVFCSTSHSPYVP